MQDTRRSAIVRAVNLIFVYGLLMRGLSLHGLLDGARFVSEATTHGTLLSLGDYPGLVEGGGTVRGELYALDDPLVALPRLDAAEEYDPQHPESSRYLRVERAVRVAGARDARAWTYLYNGSAEGCPAVASGDWRVRS